MEQGRGLHAGRVGDRGPTRSAPRMIRTIRPSARALPSRADGGVDHPADHGRVNGVVIGVETDVLVPSDSDAVVSARMARDGRRWQHRRPVRFQPRHRCSPDRDSPGSVARARQIRPNGNAGKWRRTTRDRHLGTYKVMPIDGASTMRPTTSMQTVAQAGTRNGEGVA